jgi:signal transduction histidine kinase
MLIKTIELLIKNSKEAHSKKINLSLTTDKDFITIKIEDDGDGVNKNDLPHLFLPFYSTKSLDRGLGLNFAKKYIESMKGDIFCEENKGRGVSFLIKFKL